MDLVGTWLTGIEASMLRVDDRPNERIWVWLMKNVDWVGPETAPGVEQRVRVRVRVTGLLSEPGRYGHMGTFDRQVLVSKVTTLPSAPAAVPRAE